MKIFCTTHLGLSPQEKYIWSYLRYCTCSVDVLFTKFEHMCSYSQHMCISTHVHWYTYVLNLVTALQYHIWANICFFVDCWWYWNEITTRPLKLITLSAMRVAEQVTVNPEPNMLKILPIIPFSTSQIMYPFYSHIISYYSHIILYTLFFLVLTSVFCCSCCVNVSDEYKLVS